MNLQACKTGFTTGPTLINKINGFYIFAGDNASVNPKFKLWRTDGTPAGTILLDATANWFSGVKQSLVFNNMLYLISFDNKLFTTDGYTASNYAPNLTSVSDMIIFNNKLYFFGDDHNSATSNFWSTDGTGVLTSISAQSKQFSGTTVNLNSGMAPIIVNNSLYFLGFYSLSNTSFGYLLKSNGTSAGTYAIHDPVYDYNLSPTQGLLSTKTVMPVFANNKLFFIAQTTAPARNWFEYDLSSGNVIPIQTGALPTTVTALNNAIIFAANNPTTSLGYLYSSDGTFNDTTGQLNTTQLFSTTFAGIWNDPFSGNGYSLFSFRNKLFGVAINPSHPFYDQEIFVTDGSAAGTQIITNIDPYASTSFQADIKGFTAADSTFYFIARDSVSGQSIWRTDGNPSGERLVMPTLQPASNPVFDYIFPPLVFSSPNDLVFSGFTSMSGNELWALDRNAPVYNDWATPALTSSDPTTFCQGTNPNQVQLIAVPNNLNNLQWYFDNNVISGQTSSTYSTHDTGTYFLRRTNASGCADTSNRITLSINPISGTITTTSSGANYQVAGTALNYTNSSCAILATIQDPVASGPLGNVTVNATIDSNIHTFNNAPYVAKHFDVAPDNNVPATITLYYTQADFDQYNAYVTSNNPGLPLLPQNPTDNAGIGNILITAFHGLPSSGTTGPNGQYNGANAQTITNSNISVSWDGANNWWTVSFPVTGFSGFFLQTTAFIIVPPSVTISSPSNNSSFTPADTITVIADAINPGGSITRVDFYIPGSKLGTDSVAPYSLTASNVPPGTYRVFAKAFTNTYDSLVSDTITVIVNQCLGSGTINGWGYANIPGSNVSDLTSNPQYPSNPSITAELPVFEYGSLGNNYGGWLWGYITPPMSGYYKFFISADDQAGLWLSTSDSAANKQLIAYTVSPTGFRQWNKYATQQSQPIWLNACKQYYVETLHKQATGSDHLSVGWQLPNGILERPIPGSRLSGLEDSTTKITTASLSSRNGFENGMRSVINTELSAIVMPNPSKTDFDLRLQGNASLSIQLTVTDVLGRTVETRIDVQPNSSLQLGEHWAKGIYLVRLQQGAQLKMLKLIKE